MRRTFLLTLLAACALLTPVAGAVASTGGTTPDPLPGESSGGAGYGTPLVTLPGKPQLVSQRLANKTINYNQHGALVIRINRSKGANAAVTLAIARSGAKTKTLSLGRLATNRTQTIQLPILAAGSYRLTLNVYGSSARETVRGGVLSLVVKPKSVPKPTPKPPTPSPPAPSSGVFPVRGAYTFGGAGARFGAGRTGHTHEGQDVVGDSGLPIVAPLAGEIRYVDYQASGAGRYIILRADNGWDMMFAHCQYSSAAVKVGQRVKAGDRLCLLGSTGDSTGPHLHFELWPHGWRDSPGTSPIDPLPQLKKWASN